MSDAWSLVQVPPPAKVPVDPAAKALGLLPGLRVDDSDSMSVWRCTNCRSYQSVGDALVWVPDSVSWQDSKEVVAEKCRRNAYNGCGSGWCLKCARQLGKSMLWLRSLLGMLR